MAESMLMVAPDGTSGDVLLKDVPEGRLVDIGIRRPHRKPSRLPGSGNKILGCPFAKSFTSTWTRLALNPPTSSWGRSMLAKRGGLAVQRRYRLEGRDATARATRCRVIKQSARKLAREEAKLHICRGLPAPARVKYLPLD